MTFSGCGYRWRQSLITGVAAALLLGLILKLLMGLDRIHTIQAMAPFLSYLVLGLITVLCGSAMLALVGAGVVERRTGQCPLWCV
jgi:hypothetical protein